MVTDKKLDIRKVNNGSNKYLQISMENVVIEEYEVRMINENEENGLLKVDKNIFNESINLKYCTTGLISLEEFIMDTEITKESLTKIFINILDIVDKCTFLSKKKVLFKSDVVFIDRTNLNVQLVYIPIKDECSEDIDADFREMVCEVFSSVLSKGKVKTGSGDFILQLNRACAEKEISISDIVGMCKSSVNARGVIDKKSDTKKSTPKANNPKPNSKPTINNEAKVYPKLNDLNKNESIVQKPIQTIETPQVNSVEKVKYKEIEKFKTVNLVGAIVIQPIFIGIILALFLIADVEIIQKAGGSLLLVSLDILIIRQFLDPSKKVKVKINVVDSVNKNKKKSEKINLNNTIKEKVNVKEVKVESNNIVNNQHKFNVKDEESTTYLDSEEEDSNSQSEEDTTMIANAIIEYNNGRDTGEVEINAVENYVIGRSSNLGQHMISTGVSREHLEIFFEGDVASVRDLNSTNGTKVNGDKLIGDEVRKLNDGDFIEIPEFTIIFRYN